METDTSRLLASAGETALWNEVERSVRRRGRFPAVAVIDDSDALTIEYGHAIT